MGTEYPHPWILMGGIVAVSLMLSALFWVGVAAGRSHIERRNAGAIAPVWPLVWKIALGIWFAYFSWHAISTMMLAGKFERGGNVLTHIAIDNKLTAILFSDLVLFMIGAVVLVGLIRWTSPRA